MTTLKTIIASVFIALMVATFTVAILGATNVLKLQEGTLLSFFLVLGLELSAVITAVFRTQDFFKDDPNSVANLKRNHLEELARQKKAHATEKLELEEGFSEQMSYAETISKKTISDQKQKIEEMASAHAAEIKKMKDDYMMKLAQAARAPKQVPRCDPTLLG